jgi:hypothetical protein
MSDNQTYRLPKEDHLTGKANYESWARVVEDTLRVHGSWNLVKTSATPTAPATRSSTNKSAEDEALKQGALVRIRINCSDKVKNNNEFEDDPHAMREEPKRLYKREDSTTIRELLMATFSIKLDDYSDVSDLATELTSNLNRLKRMGVIFQPETARSSSLMV